jgi:hypothetical protein
VVTLIAFSSVSKLKRLRQGFHARFLRSRHETCYLSSEEIWREITAYAFKLAMFRKFENIKSEAFPARRSRGDTI